MEIMKKIKYLVINNKWEMIVISAFATMLTILITVS